MSRVHSRHAYFYLDYAKDYPDDMAWFDRERSQIYRAWQWLTTQNKQALLLYYIDIFHTFQDRYGLWSEIISWAKAGLEIIHSVDDPPIENVLLDHLGNAHLMLGNTKEALDYQEKALQVASN